MPRTLDLNFLNLLGSLPVNLNMSHPDLSDVCSVHTILYIYNDVSGLFSLPFIMWRMLAGKPCTDIHYSTCFLASDDRSMFLLLEAWHKLHNQISRLARGRQWRFCAMSLTNSNSDKSEKEMTLHNIPDLIVSRIDWASVVNNSMRF